MKDRFISFFFFKAFKKPKFLSLSHQGVMLCILFLQTKGQRLIAAVYDRWKKKSHCHLPPYFCPLWDEMEFKGMHVQPLLVVSCQSSAPGSIMIKVDPPPGVSAGRSYCFSWRVTIVSMCNGSPPTFLKSSQTAGIIK